MISTAHENRSAVAACDDVGSNLSQCFTGLEWLAYFVTADYDAATACVIDSCGLAERETHAYDDAMLQWARYGTIRTAIQLQQVRIAQLSSTYECGICMHSSHAALSPDLLGLVVEEDSRLVIALDVLCRCALVICGIEKRSVHEAASLLGVTDWMVRAAYCKALDYLDVIRCERFADEYEYAAVCN